MIILNQNIKTIENYVTWTLTALLFILKLKIFQMTLKKDMMHQFHRPSSKGMNKNYHRLNER